MSRQRETWKACLNVTGPSKLIQDFVQSLSLGAERFGHLLILLSLCLAQVWPKVSKMMTAVLGPAAVGHRALAAVSHSLRLVAVPWFLLNLRQVSLLFARR